MSTASQSGKIKLPPEKIAELKTHLRALNDIITDIDNAEACGVDCQEFRRIRDDYYNRAQEIIKRYE